MNGSCSSPGSNRRRDRGNAARLIQWFDESARDLPWRRDRTGYTALVAEAMLQQTQVSRVVERYELFMERFPTVRALADAPEQDVLAMWQGLGYYRRARHLHAAAKCIVRHHDGNVPRTAQELKQLPGVGRYTAGAIASIVFGERAPIVDGNVVRVLARLEARQGDMRSAEGVAWSWARAEAIVDAAEQPGPCNEALMELGALICTPRQPQCGDCPLMRSCLARKEQKQHVIPEMNGGPIKQTVHHHAVIVVCGDLVLIEQRPSSGLWAGMWQVPTIEADRRLGPAQVRRRLERTYSTVVHGCTRLERFTHQTTHRRVEFDVFYAEPEQPLDGTWQSAGAIAKMPFGTPQRRIVDMAFNGANSAQNDGA